MSYTPPSGDAADFSWVGQSPYTPPTGDAANFSWHDPVNPADLLFWQEPSTNGNLLFGVTPDDQTVTISVSVDATFPDLVVEFLVLPPVDVSLDAVFPELEVEVDVSYASNTERPVINRTIGAWQIADRSTHLTGTAHQDVPSLQNGWKDAHQKTASTDLPLGIPMPDKLLRLRDFVAASFQDTAALQQTSHVEQQDTVRLRASLSQAFQSAAPSRTSAYAKHQETARVTTFGRNKWQPTVPFFLSNGERFGLAKAAAIMPYSAFEDAVVPPPGITIYVPPVDPPPFSCYEPHPDLLFSFPQLFLPDLLFQCGHYEPPGPPGNVIIPVQEVYFVTNNIQLRRVSDDALIEAPDMTLRLDVDSWTWDFSATVPAHAQAIVEPTSTGPVELKCMVNGTDFRVLAEKVSRERVFGKTMLRVSGRGRNAKLDAPYAPIQTFGNINERTAQQLMGDVLTFNGVPMPWTINWQLTDWLVPAGVFSHQGSYISALGAIAKAAGGFLLPHPNLDSFTVKHLYPKAPWEWNTVTPDFVLPSDVTVREGLEWIEKPEYNRVFVSGQQGGRLGRVTRAGTTGSLPAPMVVDPLITDAQASRQRGIAILSDTGRQLRVDLRLPVLAATGVIQPGSYVRYEDAGVNRLGIVRSTSVDMRFANVWQNLEVETHLL